MERNGVLKKAIFEAELTQRDLAQKTGIKEYIISLALTGRLNLREDEKERISDALRRPMAELFVEEGAIGSLS